MNEELVQRAIKLLRDNEPQDGKGYGLAFSGGKDSCVIKQLAIEAGVKFKAYYAETTIDPPELVQFVKRQHPDVEWIRNPKGGFFKRFIEKGFFPSMFARWCCAEFKERSIVGYQARIIGVRAAESVRRAKRWKERVDDTMNKGCWIVCPIVDWTEQDVWDFIKGRNLPYCHLYDNGYRRLGCVNCPMANNKQRLEELKRYPHFHKAWPKASQVAWERWHDYTTRRGTKHIASRFNSGEEWFNYWMSKKPYDEWKQETCQMELMFTGAQEEGKK